MYPSSHISAMQEAEIRRISVLGQHRPKKKKIPSQQEKAGCGVWWHTPVTPGSVSNSRNCKILGSWSRPTWAKSETLSPKEPEQK
jgi:hypothetical protein